MWKSTLFITMQKFKHKKLHTYHVTPHTKFRVTLYCSVLAISTLNWQLTTLAIFRISQVYSTI